MSSAIPVAQPAGKHPSSTHPLDGTPSRLPAGLQDLLALDDFDEGFEPPSSYAVGTALALLTARNQPEPAFTTIGDGSLSLSWKQGTRELQVLVPPVERIPVRLYFKDGAIDGVDSPINAGKLRTHLDWLQSTPRPVV